MIRPVDRPTFLEIDHHHVEQALWLCVRTRVFGAGQHEAAAPHLAGLLASLAGHVAQAEGITALPELRHSISARDAVLTACMRTLSRIPQSDGQPSDEDQQVAGLTLLLRLMTMNCFRGPDWKSDNSVFGRRVLHDLVAYIDEHLHPAPSLSALALLAGMSPGHFAKKFRNSTGLTLHRFITRRRIRKSLSMLQETPTSLSGVAGDLGFSSQSHFTRLFNALTGMTPAKYQRQFRRTVG